MLRLRRHFRFEQLQRFASCWSCSAASQELVCLECGKVQPPPEDTNYFRVLKQEESFILKSKVLQQQFRDLQKMLHPDKFARCSEKEKQYSADQSALVNQAYQVLLKPIQRATYLLKMKGVSLDDVQLPQEFLFDMMELNEEIDTATDQEKERILEKIEKLENAALADLQVNFRNKDHKLASETLAKVKYFENIRNRLS